jgi:pyruvate dehydrogenase (quinone)
VIIPSDLQEETYQRPPHAFKQVPSSGPATPSADCPGRRHDVRAAADMLNAARRSPS